MTESLPRQENCINFNEFIIMVGRLVHLKLGETKGGQDEILEGIESTTGCNKLEGKGIIFESKYRLIK